MPAQAARDAEAPNYGWHVQCGYNGVCHCRGHLKFFDKKTAQALLTALVFALALMFLYAAWRAIITFLFAIFFAYILEAPVSRLQKWLRGSRPAAIAVVYLLFAGLMVVTLSLLGPPVMDEATKLMQQAPEL